MKKIFSLILLLAIVNLGSCDRDDTTIIDVTGISLDIQSLHLKVGETGILAATIAPLEAIDDVTWSSNNPSVAIVSETGVVMAEQAGTATITATSVANRSLSASCTVEVTQMAQGIALDKTELSMVVGKTATLVATIYPNYIDNSVKWKTNDASIADVNNAGVVTAKRVGSALITATSVADPSKSASCTINISSPVESVTLDKTKLSLMIGKTGTLVATVNPEGADKRLTWKTSNSSTATVSDAGVVTALKSGVVTITATSVFDPTKSASCTVNISSLVKSITLDKTKLSLTIGKTATLIATVVTAEDDVDKGVTWSSGAPSFATVSDAGVVTALKSGVVTITAKSVADPAKSASCTVDISSPVESITLDKTQLSMMVGKTETMVATVVAAEDDVDKGVKWLSSNPSIATISDAGVVTALKSGQTIITATSVADLSKNTPCYVTVTSPITSIDIDVSSTLIRVGGTATLNVVVTGEADADKSVIWSSRDPSIATVSQTGVVTAIKRGGAMITATSVADPNKHATVYLTISSVELGDYWYSDDTFSTDLDPSKTAIGIVVWIFNIDPNVLQILSINEGYMLEWGPKVDTYLGSVSGGPAGTQNAISIDPDLSDFPAFKWCVSQPTTNKVNEWYLPGFAEIGALGRDGWGDNLPSINSKLTAAGGTPITFDDCYWSSTASPQYPNTAKARTFPSDRDPVGGDFDRSTKLRVRAVATIDL